MVTPIRCAARSRFRCNITRSLVSTLNRHLQVRLCQDCHRQQGEWSDEVVSALGRQETKIRIEPQYPVRSHNIIVSSHRSAAMRARQAVLPSVPVSSPFKPSMPLSSHACTNLYHCSVCLFHVLSHLEACCGPERLHACAGVTLCVVSDSLSRIMKVVPPPLCRCLCSAVLSFFIFLQS